MVYKEAPLFPPVQEAFVPNMEKGFFARLCDRLDARDEKKANAPKEKWKKKRRKMAGAAMLALCFS